MPLPLVAVAVYDLVAAAVVWVVRNKVVSIVTAEFPVEFLARMGDSSVVDLLDKARRVTLSIIADAAGVEVNLDLPIGQALAELVVRQSGVPIRTLFDREMLREDLEAYALDTLQAKSGYRLSSLTDAEKVKGDMMAIGMQIAQDRTGLPLAGVETPEQARDVLVTWAAPIVYDRLLTAVPSDESLAGGDTLLHQIRQRLGSAGEDLSSREIVRAVHSHIVASSVNLLVKAPATGKVDRRRLQLRWAQKKFRERHGKREIYVPLGFRVSSEYVSEILDLARALLIAVVSWQVARSGWSRMVKALLVALLVVFAFFYAVVVDSVHPWWYVFAPLVGACAAVGWSIAKVGGDRRSE